MKTNKQNVSFQSVRVFCSKAKMRVFLLVSMPCLIGSAWAGSMPFDVTAPDVLMHFKGSLVAVPDSTPFGPRLMPWTPKVKLTPNANPGPTPLGPPIVEPPGRRQ